MRTIRHIDASPILSKHTPKKNVPIEFEDEKASFNKHKNYSTKEKHSKKYEKEKLNGSTQVPTVLEKLKSRFTVYILQSDANIPRI